MPMPLASWNPARGVWETAEHAVCGHLAPYLEIWPRSGMTHDGTAYALPTSEPHTGGHASSSLLLLTTPTAQLAVNGGSQHPDKRKAGGHGPTLADQVEHLLPTPTARDWRSGRASEETHQRNARPLNEVVDRLLPTPTAAHYGTNKSPCAGASVRPSLDTMARTKLFPTPRAADGKSSSRNWRDSDGNPTLSSIAYELGTTPEGSATTARPSNGGKRSSGDACPLPLAWGDEAQTSSAPSSSNG